MEHIREFLEIITIKEICEKNLLQEVGKDKRTILKWLLAHNIPVFGTYKKFVYAMQFHIARESDRIKNLKKQYGDRWDEAFKSECQVLSAHRSIIQARDFQTISNSHILSEIVITPSFINSQEKIFFDSMEHNQPITIKLPKPSEHCSGLFLWCKKHHLTFSLGSRSCPGTKKNNEKCNNEDWRYKGVVHKQGNSDIRFTKLLLAKIFTQAVKELNDFKEEKFGYKNPAVDRSKIISSNDQFVSKNLIDGQKAYGKVLNNEGVPLHLHLSRSKAHIKDVNRVFKGFNACLEAHGYNTLQLPLTKLDDDLVGIYHEYLLKTKNFKNRTYNKHISILTTFFRWAQEKNNNIVNAFERVKHRPISPDPLAITKDEVEKLLNVTTPENGIAISKGKKKEKRNYYRTYIQTVFKCGLFIGARREELANLKFNSVIEDSEGTPAIIKIPDFKVNAIQHRSGPAELRYHFIPINKEMRELLNELNYDKFKNTENFIIAPEITQGRKRLGESFSSAFHHFNKVAGNNSNLTFGSLRNRYSTAMELATGNSQKFTHNSSIMLHYLDRMEIANVARNFEIFPEGPKRREFELKEVRKQKGLNQPLER